ncbi:uncharacterized protein LOC125585252 isoform X1 [Brassica napus]|uniref:uncharacterized protein LOC125585252 isoform X1 n=1 Tax=Brassica napus TaxID=3708 RepID=UPI00207AEBE5|nr:uncharacterized protein LOC125585252 isoform X1 [Brassica napus]
MEVNVLPGAGVGHVVLLVGGGARVTIPPGNGFTIIVNPVAGGAVGAAGGAMGAAGGAMGAAVANENIAAITADIVQHSVNNTLSTTQILHMLRVDNTFEVHQVFVPEPPATGLFLYAMGISRGSDHHHYLNPPRYYRQQVQFGAAVVVMRHRRRVAAHPEHVPFETVVCRRYLINGDPRFLLHYLQEDEDNAFEEEPAPANPIQPVVQLLL